MKGKIIAWTSLFFSTAAMAQTGPAEEKAPLSLDSFSAKIERQQRPQIIDARSSEEYSLNHITGAVNYSATATGSDAFPAGLNAQRPVFVYAIANGRSGQLVKVLRSKGFQEVYELQGGIAAWVGGGKPYFTTARSPKSLKDYQATIGQKELVLVAIGSRYCGACKKVKPVLDSLRQQYGGKLTIVELELEESPQLIAQLNTVTAFPYLILYRSGNIVFRRNGQGNLSADVAAEVAKDNSSAYQSKHP